MVTDSVGDRVAPRGVVCWTDLLILAWRLDRPLRPLQHPLITDLRQQVDIQLGGLEKRRILGQSLDQVANPRQLRGSLRIIITCGVACPFPRITEVVVQGAPDGLARDRVAPLRRELQTKCGTAPASATPAAGTWRPSEDGDERALPATQLRRGWSPRRWLILRPARRELTSPVSSDRAVDATARAEENISNLGRREAARTQEQNVQPQQVTIAGLAQFGEHLLLFFSWELKYRFSRRRRPTSDIRFGSTYRCIRKGLSVPISDVSI